MIHSIAFRLLVSVQAALLSSLALAEGTSVAYPDGYRHWSHVKSMVIEQGHGLYDSFGGIHHIYANRKALEGYKGDADFRDGSVIVFDLLEAKNQDHAVTEGDRKVVGVMVKDRNRYADTGGWGYEGFAGGDPARPVVGDNAEQACHGCHRAREDEGYVFSNWRE